ncbi:MAG: class I SAM-dependent methyltransferase [Christensenellaceae bacterium]|nr:class I SAM-dependent methyltransferase [Christensenellaceae bacterium]
MPTRIDIINDLYNQIDEDSRLQNSRQGQLEYIVTMNYIHRYITQQSKVLELGAGTGRYSIALAKEGMDVSAVELVESNLAVLRENSKDIENIKSYKGDATNLDFLGDNLFDVTLVFGPLYHLYEPEDVHKAIDEAIRVTKPSGVILFAFISIFGIMYTNFFKGNWAFGQKLNFTDNYKIRHFKEQLFTGYDIVEFESLFEDKPVEWITTTGTDGLLEAIEARPDFAISDEDFKAFTDWYMIFSEKRELLGSTNHLLYICRKK